MESEDRVDFWLFQECHAHEAQLLEMGPAGWGSLGGLVPVFILRPPMGSPVPVSPPNQETLARAVLQTKVKNGYLVQGTPAELISVPWDAFPAVTAT